MQLSNFDRSRHCAINNFSAKMSSQMSAIELLKLGDQGRTRSFLTVHWPNILGVSFGVLTGVFLNFQTRRPVFSGIQKHVLGIAAWTTLLNVVQNKREAYFAEKDAVYRHYVELHPEDFVTPERKKICDIFEPWIPIR